ncbi:MAG: 50S ribosomal protein L30e [Promethearchaeota archaeon]
MGMDLNKLINIAVQTGRVYLGTESVLKRLRHEDLKMVVFAKNCPTTTLREVKHHLRVAGSKAKVLTFPASSWELGLACGKPFWVATLGIEDPGDSDILEYEDVAANAEA